MMKAKLVQLRQDKIKLKDITISWEWLLMRNMFLNQLQTLGTQRISSSLYSSSYQVISPF